ncbi:MAG: chitobiase/beta-hexosaminidase C-terminal domain-containing protein, partial [Bacteroidales bacterium]|nr:chitobiase/beta-hexosaminidase C-terminal domain-containing protein [Bacteroidales bacterium]
GVAALLLEADPELTPADIDRIIETSAVKCEGYTTKNNYYGAGRVDAYEAVVAASASINPPTNVSATEANKTISLSWTAATGAASYEIYCNEELLASEVTGTSYSYLTSSIGTHQFYLKSVDANGKTSAKSNYASIFVEPDGPIATNLAATVDGNQVALIWEAPIPNSIMRYGDEETTSEDGIGNNGGATYWAQRFKPSELLNHAGAKIDTLSIYLLTSGTYNFYIYSGNANGTDEKLFEKQVSVTSSEVPGWYAVAVTTPVDIPMESDLWFVANAGSTVSNPASWCYISTPNPYASMMSTDGKNWYNYNTYNIMSWMMKAHLSPSDYTYNVQRDGQEVANNLTTLSYTDNNVADGVHYYTVTTNYNNNQNVSIPSDSLRVNVNIQFTVTFDAGTGTCENSQITQPTSNAAITLPSASPSSACQTTGYTFAGWSTEVIENQSERPELLLAGSSYTPQENLTLYAVYELVQGNGYSQVRALSNGDVVSIVCNDYSVEFDGIDVANGVGASSAFTEVPEGVHTFTVDYDQNNGNCFLKDENDYYLCKKNSSGVLQLTTKHTATNGSLWKILIIDGQAILRNTTHNSNHQLAAELLAYDTIPGYVFACVPYDEAAGSNAKDIQLYRNSTTYSYEHEPSCSALVANPKILPIAEGIFLDAVTLTMTCATSDAQIYYTIDNTEPSTNSFLYNPNSQPVINSTTTVKAIAVKDAQTSAVTEQTYTFPTAYASIAAFKTAANTSVAAINANMTVTYQSGNYLYVCDPTGGLLLYDEYGFVDEDFAIGDQINPIQGCYASVNGQPMMVLWNSVEKTGENVPAEPTTLSISTIDANYASYDAQLVLVESVHFAESLDTFSGGSILISQESNSLLAVDQFGTVDCAVDATHTYDVVGLLGINNGEIRIYPRTNEDIRTYYNITCATAANGSITVNKESAAELSTVTVTATPAAGYHVESICYYGSDPEQTTAIDLTTMQFVMPAEDITISAVFAQDVLYTVTFNMGNGSGTVTSMSETAWHSGITLPNATPSQGCASQGYVFAGWSESYVSETMVEPTLFKADSTYYPAGNITLYAVYALGDNEWHDVSSVADIVEGAYVITTRYSSGSTQKKYFYMPVQGAMAPPSATLTTVSDDNIPAANTHLWTISLINNSKENPEYSITSEYNGTTYYLKANYDGNNAIQVTPYDPGTGWVFSDDSSHGLMACFPSPVADPSKSVRYLDLNYRGNYTSNWYFHTISRYSGELHLFLSPSNIYATDPDCQAVVEAPVINHPEGIIDTDQYEVVITHADANVNIYYTLDGSDPTSASTQYTNPFVITEDCTVKAIAINNEGMTSSIASYDFVFISGFDNIAAFKNAYQSTSLEEVKITGDLTVVFQDGNYLYVVDNTAGLMINDVNGVISNSYSNGMVISDGLFGTMNVDDGQQQLIPTRDPGQGVQGTEVSPETVQLSDLSDHDAELVTVSEVVVEQIFDLGANGIYYRFAQEYSKMYMNDLFGNLTSTLNVGDHYDITGFVGIQSSMSNQFRMLYPRSDDDIEPYFNVVCDTTLPGGMISADVEYAKPGDEVTLSVTPANGYTLDEFIVTDCNGQTVEVTGNSFVMPSCSVSVTADFIQTEYEITWTINPNNGGSVMIEEAGPYHYGDIIHATAVPAEGFVFVKWLAGGVFYTEATKEFEIKGDLALTVWFEIGSGTIDHTATLNSGWSWFSSYIEYTDASLGQLEDYIAASSDAAIIKSQSSFVGYENGTWSGTLTRLNNKQMYLISSDGCEITFSGVLADPADYPIELTSGWSWIGYVSNTAININEALESITPKEGDMVKSQSSFATYTANLGWTGAMMSMTPGQGYLYQSNGGSGTLIYPSSSKGIVDETPVETYWNANHHAFPTNLTMMVTLDE